MPTKKRKKKLKFKNRSLLTYILFSVYFLLIALFIGYHVYFSNKIVYGVHINGRDLSGLSAEQSIKLLREQLPKEGQINVQIGEDYTTQANFEDIGFEYLPVESTKLAFSVGRDQNFIGSLKDKIVSAIKPKNIEPAYQYSESKMEMYLTSLKQEAGIISKETSFVLSDETETPTLEIIAGTTGETFNESSIHDKILQAFASEEFNDVNESLFQIEPEFTVADLDEVKPKLQEYLSVDYALKYDNQIWALSDQDIVNFFEVKRNADETLRLELDEVEVAKKLSEISQEIDRNPRGQVLEVENGKAVKFVASEDGLKLKIKESSEIVEENILAKTPEIPLQVQVTQAPESENQFGIDELIGLGTSRFKGSIPGRVHNIGLAAERVSGTMVAPGDEFSFVEAVGPINRSTGFTSAYIISQGRTVLGDGGGVCQVSTTMFRAALDAGFPITERNAHSYRVSYYEQDSPVGIDAAIYSPSVDLRFKNDSPGYILITAEFSEEDSSLAFKIYGTDDGREVEISEPVVHSRTPPPAPVYEDDPSRPKGQTVRVESPVWGASVSFGRIVKKDGEVVIDETFRSNYRAWRAIYKVGTAE